MLDQVIKYVVGELSVIAQAPVSFVLCLVVITIGVWRAVVWHYRGMTESLEGRIKLKDDQITDYKSKLSGASPDEAKARIDTLEQELRKLKPRRLSDADKRTVGAIAARQASCIEVIHDAAAAEVRGLALDLTQAFQGAGWETVSSTVMGLGRHPQSGIFVRVADQSRPSAAEQIAIRVLETLGIPFDIDPHLMRAPPQPPEMPAHLRRPEPQVGILFTTRLN